MYMLRDKPKLVVRRRGSLQSRGLLRLILPRPVDRPTTPAAALVRCFRLW